MKARAGRVAACFWGLADLEENIPAVKVSRRKIVGSDDASADYGRKKWKRREKKIVEDSGSTNSRYYVVIMFLNIEYDNTCCIFICKYDYPP